MAKKLKKEKKAIMSSTTKLVNDYKDISKDPVKWVAKTAKKANAHGNKLKGDGFATSDTGKKKRTLIMLKSFCRHFRMKKSGKLAPAIFKGGNDPHVVQCRQCGEKFPFTYMDNGDLKQRITSVLEVLNQMKYLGAAYQLGDELQKYLASLSFALRQMPGIYDRESKVSYKSRNKKDRQKYDSQSHSAGGWAITKNGKGYSNNW